MPTKKQKAENPILSVNVQDLYEKDPEDFSEEERGRILEYYRELRRVYEESESEAAAKREAKKQKTLEEHANTGFD